jgi:hypothetical protein
LLPGSPWCLPSTVGRGRSHPKSAEFVGDRISIREAVALSGDFEASLCKQPLRRLEGEGQVAHHERLFDAMATCGSVRYYTIAEAASLPLR